MAKHPKKCIICGMLDSDDPKFGMKSRSDLHVHYFCLVIFKKYEFVFYKLNFVFTAFNDWIGTEGTKKQFN